MNELQLFLSHIGDPSYLANHYGALFYVITFCWTAVEGETFVIIAGLLAQKGYLNIDGLFFAAWLGSFFGDQIVFMLGRRYGMRMIKHFPKIKPGVERAVAWLDRYAVAFILSYRFIYGVRNVSGVAVGMSHLSWKKFALWNCTAAFVWALTFVGFGYLYGNVLSHMNHKQQVVEDSVRQIMLAMLGLFALAVVGKLISIRFSRMRRAKKAPKT
jgi:membrane protein DedA with SNARE-associated domain